MKPNTQVYLKKQQANILTDIEAQTHIIKGHNKLLNTRNPDQYIQRASLRLNREACAASVQLELAYAKMVLMEMLINSGSTNDNKIEYLANEIMETSSIAAAQGQEYRHLVETKNIHNVINQATNRLDKPYHKPQEFILFKTQGSQLRKVLKDMHDYIVEKQTVKKPSDRIQQYKIDAETIYKPLPTSLTAKSAMN